jgi:hypothetical protein
MSDPLGNPQEIPDGKLSEECVPEATIASGDGAVSITGDVTDTVAVTGNQNITGDNNSFVINQGIGLEQVRLIIQHIESFRSSQPRSSLAEPQNAEHSEEISFRPLVLDLTTLAAINRQINVIDEIYHAGYLSEQQQQQVRQLLHQIQLFNKLNQDLQGIEKQGNSLIQVAVSAMRLQLEGLKLAGREITLNNRDQVSNREIECQQEEAQIIQTFIDRLEDSRIGAEWIVKSMKMLISYASDETFKQFAELSTSEEVVGDFKFSLKQFLEQVNFCLYWGSYEILDSPEIPLVLGIEQYEVAFQAIKKAIPKRFRRETIQEIETCLDYLLDHLVFYQ